MVKIDISAQLVLVQFTLANAGALPAHLRQRTQTQARTAGAAGTEIVPEGEKTSLAEVPAQLEALGFELVDGHFEVKPRERRHAWKVQYAFARKGSGREPHPQFAPLREAAQAELNMLMNDAFWRVRVFLNPLFHTGQPVEGKSAICIEADSRLARLHPNGSPVTVWQRDAAGEKVGEAPLPLAPERILRIADSDLGLPDVALTPPGPATHDRRDFPRRFSFFMQPLPAGSSPASVGPIPVPVVQWKNAGLLSRVRRFDSYRGHQKKHPARTGCFFLGPDTPSALFRHRERPTPLPDPMVPESSRPPRFQTVFETGK